MWAISGKTPKMAFFWPFFWRFFAFFLYWFSHRKRWEVKSDVFDCFFTAFWPKSTIFDVLKSEKTRKKDTPPDFVTGDESFQKVVYLCTPQKHVFFAVFWRFFAVFWRFFTFFEMVKSGFQWERLFFRFFACVFGQKTSHRKGRFDAGLPVRGLAHSEMVEKCQNDPSHLRGKTWPFLHQKNGLFSRFFVFFENFKKSRFLLASCEPKGGGALTYGRLG